MTENYLNTLTNMIYSAPIWIQEVIYLDLKQNIQNMLPDFISSITNNETYSTYIPIITFKGKQELENHTHNLDINIYKLLEGVSKGQRIVDITLNNFWTLEQISAYLSLCIKNELINAPNNTVLIASILYLAGEIRLGEYVKRINKISITELDEILRAQKHYNNENPEEQKKIGELLIEMGYVANNDIDKILKMKSEAKRRFILHNNEQTVQNADLGYDEIQQKIKKLTEENHLLKNKLRAIFNIQNKKA